MLVYKKFLLAFLRPTPVKIVAMIKLIKLGARKIIITIPQGFDSPKSKIRQDKR